MVRFGLPTANPNQMSHEGHLRISVPEMLQTARTENKAKRPQPEGLRRYQEKKRQEREERLQRLGILPKSHYKKLSDEQKHNIRKFEFLKLPLELRMEIYGYLFVSTFNHRQPWTNEKIPSESGCLPVSWQSSFIPQPLPASVPERDRFRSYGGGMELTLLKTCITIYKEGHQFIGEKNVVRFGANTGEGFAWFCASRRLPAFLKLEWITRVQMFFTIDANGGVPELEVKWRYLIEGMTRLKELHIAIAFFLTRGDRLQRNDTHRLKNRRELFRKTCLNGFISTAMMHIPKHVTLKWGPWPTLLETDIQNQSCPVEFTRLLRASLLEDMAGRFQSIRGMAAELKR